MRNRNSTGGDITNKILPPAVASRLAWRAIIAYVGRLNSLASQPCIPDIMGSLDTTVVRTQPQLWHSNVR
jgi:hypothetical protein